MYFELILYATIAIGFSFFCSIAEAVLLSITPSFIANLQKTKSSTATLLADLKGNIERPLAAILSLNTIAHTAGAAGVGASAAEIWGSQIIALASAVMTFAILILSEIIPKTIGANYWRQLAPIVGRLTRYLIFLLYPLVLLSEYLSQFLSNGKKTNVVTRDEVAAMAELGAQGGAIAGQESKILRNLFRFDSLRVRDIMTPRTVLIAFPSALTAKQALEQRPNLPVSRIPVYKDNIDSVVGYVLKTDLLLEQATSSHSTRQIDEMVRPMRTVSESDSLPALLDTLMDEREHIALVTGAYGGTQGVVTLEDLVETLLGHEIVDEADQVEDMQSLARQMWEKRSKGKK